MLSPPSELTNNSPLTKSAATESSVRSSICSIAAGCPLHRVRRRFRPNECSQDLSFTAGDPFPDKRGLKSSQSSSESACSTDCATEFVHHSNTAYDSRRFAKNGSGGTRRITDTSATTDIARTTVTGLPPVVTPAKDVRFRTIIRIVSAVLIEAVARDAGDSSESP